MATVQTSSARMRHWRCRKLSVFERVNILLRQGMLGLQQFSHMRDYSRPAYIFYKKKATMVFFQFNFSIFSQNGCVNCGW